MTAYSMLSHLECSREGSSHDPDVVQGTSPLGAPLLARYDLERVAATVTPPTSPAGTPIPSRTTLWDQQGPS